MEELIMGGAPVKHSVWDNYVPIIKTDRHTDIYLTAQIEAPAEYAEMCRILEQAFKGDTITLHINSGGGYVDSGFMIIDAINSSKAVVTAKLSGTVASIATIIALSCVKVVIADHISWLSHNYSAGIQGKGGEMKLQMEFMSKELSNSFRALHKGFFTDAEMTSIIDDKDVWLNKSEIVKRWAARKENNTDKLKEIAAAKKGE